MNSKITIDFTEDFKPIIKVSYRETNDVRDKLLRTFIEKCRLNSASPQLLSINLASTSEGEGEDFHISPLDTVDDELSYRYSSYKDHTVLLLSGINFNPLCVDGKKISRVLADSSISLSSRDDIDKLINILVIIKHNFC